MSKISYSQKQKNHRLPMTMEKSTDSPLFSPSPSNQNNGKSDNSFTVAQTIVDLLLDLGVSQAFGVSGGAIATLWATLEHSPIEVFHFRHEAGAGFAAIESYFANDRPVVVFTTTGPGITNALTGMLAARWEGAKVIFISPATSAPQRGKWAFQETSTYTMPAEIISTAGSLFHYATSIETGEELPEIGCRLAQGLAQPGGFVAHLSVPTIVQSLNLATPVPKVTFSQELASAGAATISKCIQLLSEAPFAIWVGFGARKAAAEIRELAEKTGAAVMCSPRGKGIFPEDHPQFIGVTGFGGHDSVLEYMQKQGPLHILVLGTRLSEFTSFWSPAMVPVRSFLHVDINPEVTGVAYPSVETVSIQSEIGVFVRALLEYFPHRHPQSIPVSFPNPERRTISPSEDGYVQPDVLMKAIQRVIVEGSDAVVITEAGNSFAWGTHTLRFSQPGRYRVSTGFGSMGHAATGVIGAALATLGKAVAILGDGAMLMNSEVNTAVKYQIPAVWIVLNDARYNMCAQGMSLLGFQNIGTEIAPTDFVAVARGMGADGIRLARDADMDAALKQAMATTVPFVVDVTIDPSLQAPCGTRIKSLIAQGAK